MSHSGNLPIPAGPRAPITVGWFFHTAPPAAIIGLYRTLFSPARRAKWNKGNGFRSTSHEALAAVLAPQGGWKAFRYYATPRFAGRRSYGFAMAWTLFLFSSVFGLSMAKTVSWAN